MVAPGAFDADPLRVLRVARLAVELGFSVDPATLAAARERAPRLTGVSPERVFAELRGVVDADAALDGIALLDELGATTVVLPELEALRGVEQTVYHHLDVHGHTLAVLERDDRARSATRRRCSAPSAPPASASCSASRSRTG